MSFLYRSSPLAGGKIISFAGFSGLDLEDVL